MNSASVNSSLEHRYTWPGLNRRTELVLLMLVLLVAIVFRVYALNEAPPGLTHDEANNGHDAWMILQGVRPLYFPTGYGHEPLFFYWMAGFVAVLGRTVTAIRLAAVVMGLLALLSTYLVMRRLFGPPVALLTAALMAVSFWTVGGSRQGLRSISLPPFIALAVYFFWTGMMRDAGHAPRAYKVQCTSEQQSDHYNPEKPGASGKRRSLLRTARRFSPFVVGGLCLGAALYTYMASRGMPALFLLFVVYLALFHRQRLRAHWAEVALFFVIAALIAAPLFLYLHAHPELETRVSGLAFGLREMLQGKPQRVLRHTGETLLMFTFRGDPLWLYNIPYRPVFGPLSGVLFYLGLGIALRRWREPRYALLLIWIPVGLAPSMVTGPAPNWLRTIGAQPAIYALAAIGGIQVCKLASERIAHCKLQYAICNMVLLVVLGHAAWTARDYFGRWARHPQARLAYNRNQVEQARYLQSNPEGGVVCLSSLFPEHWHDPYIFEFTLHRDDLSLRWFDGRGSLVLPDAKDTRYIVPAGAPLHPALAEEFRIRAQLIEERVLRPDDVNPSFAVYRLNPAAWRDEIIAALAPASEVRWSPETSFPPGDPQGLRKPLPLPVDVGHQVELIAYQRTPSRLAPGETLQLITYWRVLQPTDEQLVLFAHLLSAEGKVVAGQDVLHAPSTMWVAEDVVMQVHTLALPGEISQGEHQLEIGFYRRSDGGRLPVYDAQGQPVADRLLLQPVEIYP